MKNKEEVIKISENIKEKLTNIRWLFECLSKASINGMDSKSIGLAMRCFQVLLDDIENDISLIQQYLIQKQTVL